jgi:hypothetical protein
VKTEASWTNKKRPVITTNNNYISNNNNSNNNSSNRSRQVSNSPIFNHSNNNNNIHITGRHHQKQIMLTDFIKLSLLKTTLLVFLVVAPSFLSM